jgi:superfamily II DNA helicase RecQ
MGSTMDIPEAIGIIQLLADGMDPQTKVAFAYDSPYQHPQIARALYVALQILARYVSEPLDERTDSVPQQDVQLTPSEEVAYKALKVWRTKKASEEGYPAYAVANNAALKQMIKFRAKTTDDLGKIKAFGDKRAQRYGHEILEILQAQQLGS